MGLIDVSLLVSMCAGRERHFNMSLQSFTCQKYNKERIELLVFLDYLKPSKAISLLKHYRYFFHSIQCYVIRAKKNPISHSASRRNFLATKAKGEYLLFSEPEMLHVGPTLSSLFKFTSQKRPNYWFCGPVYATASVVNPTTGKIAFDEYDKQENVNFLLDLASKRVDDFFNPKMRRYYFKIDKNDYPFPFFCALIRRKFFFKLGGLCQDFKVRGWEDLEFAQRFQQKGGKLYFDKHFVTCHLPHKRTLPYTSQFGWDLYNSTVIFNPNQQIGALPEKVTEIFL